MKKSRIRARKTQRINGIGKVHKPKLLELAKKHGGVTKLAELLGVSQGRISQLIYGPSKVSDTIAEAVFELTEGKLNLFSIAKIGQKSIIKKPNKEHFITDPKHPEWGLGIKSISHKDAATKVQKPATKVKSNEKPKAREDKKLKAKAPGTKVQKPAKEESGTKQQIAGTITFSEIFGIDNGYSPHLSALTKGKPTRPKVQKQTKQRKELPTRRLPRSRGAALFDET